MYGWTGRGLEVDLSSGASRSFALDPEILRQFVGGRGLGARLLWDLVGPGVDALSPENVLIFCTGPMTGTAFQTSSRFSVSTKSPLTGTILDANSGGSWGMRFKRTGFDVLIVRGRAEKPVCLEVTPGGVQVEDASHLWGMMVSETSRALGASAQRGVLCIGPAGERLVRFASIMNDGTRALGRGGPGAVMGSKNLKAVVVQGDEKVTIADRDRFRFIRYEASKQLTANPLTSQALPQLGTAGCVNILNTIGVLPTRNFQQSRFECAEELSGEAVAERILEKKAACWACPIACGRVTRTSHAAGEGPEYESLWALGIDCGIGDLEAVTEANYLCNELGVDTISMGATIACAMELTERGNMDARLRFGDASALEPAIRTTAYRKGIGDELAEGSLRFARIHDAADYSMTVKGLEMPAYDPRGMQGQGLLFATSNRGACHMRGNMLGPEVLGLPKLVHRLQVQGKAGIVILHQNGAAAIDSLVLCKFTNMAVSEEYLARVLSAVTGVQYSTGDLMRLGERIWNLERLYNLREGFTRAEDTLPRRLLEEPVVDGPTKGWVSHVPEMLDEYYDSRHWDSNGVPSREKVAELGLDQLGLCTGEKAALEGAG
jgi:aldehyde:ferredoxin oxidoreductase